MNASKALSIAAVCATSFLAYENADAIPVTVSDADPHYLARIAACVGSDGTNYKDCTSAAHLNATNSLVGNDAEFKKSFDAWNATNAAGAKWTLANGGNLPGGAFNVSIFDALAFVTAGGLEIQIDWTYTGADKGNFKWAQGLFDNYLVDGSIVAAHYEVDVRAAGCDNTNLEKQCPPLYPIQWADQPADLDFYDKPLGPWPNSSFEAWTFLSKADFTARQLTIFEGVNYGFRLSVSEPPTWLLFVIGTACLIARMRETTRSPRWVNS